MVIILNKNDRNYIAIKVPFSKDCILLSKKALLLKVGLKYEKIVRDLFSK
ncbi:hypothetical protein JCM19294_104 [Nonlabens tegetincola]|uniref:Uncharacterized protein n=1 Tax=Nonlabens tegetincola TaxID=323273 RepID=A0A090Q742_9FLAO|nr:hypothetical protein JCM19294_104 [Nonlabens tegetincola]